DALEGVAEAHAANAEGEELESPLLLVRCRALLGLGRWREVAESAEKKLEELYALRPDDKRSILEFHIAAGRAAWRLGRPPRAEEHVRAAYHISRWDFEDTTGMLRTRNLLGLCFLGAGELHRAAAEFERGRKEASEAGLYHEEAAFALNASIAALKLGRLPKAETELDRARLLYGERGHSRGKVQARLVRSWLLRVRGDLRAADWEARGSLSEAEEHGFERERVIALEYLGEIALDRHDNQAAIERLDEALGLAERLAPEGDLIPELCRRIAEVHARIGEPNRALVTCERGLRIAKRINDRYEEAATYRVMATAHLLLGHRERAVRTAQEGIQILRKLEAAHELLRLLVWIGETLLAGGDAEDRRQARDFLWEARSIAMSMRLDPWVERVEKVLGVELRAPRAIEAPKPAAADTMPPGADPTCFRFGIVTGDPRMAELIRMVERAANSRLPILILGECGVGKELLARAAHAMSERRDGVFVVSHCAALPEGQLDSELFGEESDVGTVARSTRPGLFEAANRGVIFLDEVSELLTGAQAKLLRVIENGELRRVGGIALQQVEVRVIAASTRDVPSLVRRGLFRDDLYYRLNGIRLEVPPLRERPGDIRLIGSYLLERAAAQSRKSIALSEEAWSMLEAHGWPGNVRELRNVLDRAVALGRDGDTLGPEAIQLPAARAAGDRKGARARASSKRESRVERETIVNALKAHGGNQSEAARSLGGMKRTTLLYKMKKHDIRPEEYSS
ncbi:MAG TPA: sigma 54-interacting transcriptional regulator, partial [Candidatus Eisenbacteria bacterium]|nr:sigma 54-interacting transcriptional regulator [Candidatus Eisenbacteria bacterium]